MEKERMIHLYFGDDHRICRICGYNLPIEYMVIIGKLLICQSCAKELKNE